MDLARLAGLYPAGVICEIMNEDGTMARVPELELFCRHHALKMITVKDLIRYRMSHERLVRKIAEANLPTTYGAFRIHAFESLHRRRAPRGPRHGGHRPRGRRPGARPLAVPDRGHLRFVPLRLRGPARQGPGDDQKAGRGVLLYLRQEGRGIGLVHKIMAYQLQDQGKDTVEANEALGFKADQRDYGIGAQILVELGVRRMRLMTNNPRKFVGLEGYGLEIVERLPLEVPPSDASRRYLKTKKEKLGHLLRSV